VENRDISFRYVLRNLNSFTFFSLLLTVLQRRIGKKLGVRAGEEMLQAVKVAEEVGAFVYFIDRPLHITFQRLWKRMSLKEKIKIIFMTLSSFLFTKSVDIERMKDEDFVSAILKELGRASPSALEVLVEERDAYMASKLLKLPDNLKVVAVVGIGHVKGIKKYLENPEEILVKISF
jgi:pheromone shutdown-related protein TraB